MAQNNKSLPVWCCDQGRYYDVGLDFPYSIIHRIGDTGYLTAGAGGAFLTAIESLWCRIGHFEWQYRHV